MLFLVGRRDGIVFAAYIGGGLLFGFEIPFSSLVFLFSLVDPSPFFGVCSERSDWIRRIRLQDEPHRRRVESSVACILFLRP